MYEEEQALVGRDAWKERTLIDLVTFRRLTRGEQPIFLFLGDGATVTASLSAARLHDEAGLVAAHLSRTLPPGARVLLLFENGLDYIVAFFACLYAGLVPVSGAYPTSIGARERFTFLLRDSEAQGVIGLRETLRLFHEPDPTSQDRIRWIPMEAARNARSPLSTPVTCGPETLALVQYSSGSTESPKGVCLTHRNICYNIHAQLLSFRYQDHDTGLSWLPFTHDMGLVGAVLPALAAGNPFYFMAPEKFIERPARWLEAISRYGVTISGGPDFAYRYCARLAGSDVSSAWDLSRWTIAFNGSETISADTLSSFATRYAAQGFRPEAFYSCYGLAENALLVTSGVKGRGVGLACFDRAALGLGRAVRTGEKIEPGNVTVLASCGTAREEQSVHIADPDTGAFLPDDTVGEIWISGPSVSIGYLGNALRNARSFVEKDGRRYLRSQDSGFIHQGELFVVGRLSERFELRGSIYYTNDIALSLGQALDGALCVVAPPTGPENPVPSLIVEQHGAVDPSHLRSILQTVMRSYRIDEFAYFLIRKGFVARTPSGKVRADLTLAIILKENSAILCSGDTQSPVASGPEQLI